MIRYRPSTVLVYAGDNDLAAGTTPEEVLHRFTAFVEGVHRELPDTRIAYISIKPSPSRIGLLPQIRQTNTLIRDYAEGLERVSFIDSSGLNVLAGLSVKLRSLGGDLTLRNVPTSIRRTLEIAGLSHLVGTG